MTSSVRRAPRFKIRLWVQVTGIDPAPVLREGDISASGLYLHNWGPGPHFIRLGVFDLEAKAEQLREQGIAFEWVPESDAVGGAPLIRIDPRELDGQVFELEGLAE